MVDERVVVDLLLAARQEEPVERRSRAVAVEPDRQLVPHEPAADREDVAEELRAGAEVGLGRPEVVRLDRLFLERRVVEVGVRAEDDLGHRVHERLAGAAVRLDDRRLRVLSEGDDDAGVGGDRSGAPVGDVDDEERLGEDDAVGDVDEGAVEQKRRVHRDEGVGEVSAKEAEALLEQVGRGGEEAREGVEADAGRKAVEARELGVEAPVHEDELVVLSAGDGERAEGGERGASRGGPRGRGPRGRCRRGGGAVRRAFTDEVRQTPGDRRDARVAPLLVGGAWEAELPERLEAGAPQVLDEERARRRLSRAEGPCALDDRAGPLREGRRQDRGGGRGAQDAVPAPTAASSSSQP